MALADVAATAATSAADSMAAISVIFGCYRLASAAEARASEEKSLGQRAAAAGAPTRAQPSAPALRDRADFAERPSIVRLDTTRARGAFRVRDPRSSSYLGTWQRVGDTLRVDLFAHGVFTIAPADSVKCP
jgi:hypothetical protein